MIWFEVLNYPRLKWWREFANIRLTYDSPSPLVRRGGTSSVNPNVTKLHTVYRPVCILVQFINFTRNLLRALCNVETFKIFFWFKLLKRLRCGVNLFQLNFSLLQRGLFVEKIVYRVFYLCIYYTLFVINLLYLNEWMRKWKYSRIISNCKVSFLYFCVSL